VTLAVSFDEYRVLAARGGIVPVVREFTADTLTPVAAYAAIARAPFSFLLESLVGGERWARYTFMGTDPSEAWRYRGGAAEQWTRATGWRPAGPAPDPLAHVAAQLRPLQAAAIPGLPRFSGGAVGYLGYDVVRGFERLPHAPADDLGLPDAVFLIADTLVIIDNAYGKAIVVANTRPRTGDAVDALRRAYDEAEGRIADLLRRLKAPPTLVTLPLDQGTPISATSPYARAAFERDVDVIRDHIRAGDVFQTVLSRRLDVACEADPLSVYRALRALNPAPYLYFLQLDDFAVAGSSPEVLVRVEDGEITYRPIAGTAPRGADAEADRRLAEALLADPKELAEHMMLVDLGRNDVGRSAAYGSVRVTADKVIERYSHVQHIVSEVRGQVRDGLDAVDVLRACFPAGTLTGAPKVRAMELIDQLEPTRRGPYGGAVGYIGWGAKTLDTAIAIRTAILRGGRAHIQVGAGIVADSVPAREYAETEDKAGALLRALALASPH
jgi:anthranilate synthase component 1